MTFRDFPLTRRNSQSISLYTPKEDKSSLYYAVHDQHNLPEIDNSSQEGILRSRTVLKDLGIVHEYHLEVF